MINNCTNKKRFISGLMLLFSAFVLSSASCSDNSGGDCTKCIDNKPAPTGFSTTLNAINHSISLEQAVGMVNHYEQNRDSLVHARYLGTDILPYHETFNLKAIDSLICQKNAIGFRVYMALDNKQKIRFVLVGVDGDGKDIIQRKKEDPGKYFSVSDNVSILVEEAGQRWP